MNDDTIQALRNHALADQAKTLPRTEAAFASWSPRSIREEFERMERDLARVTAELEHHKSVKETIDSAHKELSREHAALRARVAELEDESADLRLKVTELRRRIYEIQQVEKPAIARAESATPAKHPDAEPEVIGGYEGEGGRRFWWTGGTWLYPGQEVAVISARKQEAAR